MDKIVLFGPGPMFKGGIANYNTSLAKAFDKEGIAEVHIVSWTQQYPAIIPRDFIDRKSKTDLLDGTNIKVHYITNYNNPSTWNDTYKLIKEINPKIIVFQWSIAVQGIPLGNIVRKIKKNTNIEVLFDLHFVIQKEGSNLDKMFTKYGISKADKFVVHSLKTAEELKKLFPSQNFNITAQNSNLKKTSQKDVIKLYHPVYDMFKPDESFDIKAQKESLHLNKYVFLFFGFIRKYKGLHNVIPAFAKLAEKRDDVSLLIVGESFWQTLDKDKFSTKIKEVVFGLAKKIFLKKSDDERNYNPLTLIEQLNIKDKTVVINDFVPNEDVNKYFQVSDAIILFYETATPSGVESISYNFKLPILATSVGHFPETVKDGYNGYLANPNSIEEMAEAMNKQINNPIDKTHIEETTKEMSWANYAKAIWY
ncbi:MAG: hypothetical protein A2X02_10200 [Bacteroidetes bacterium GWF2_29_10]|nr:MAG: hypothetical protein A2X02_10200 [Bacteroidetes bacterium GWF2_29_10]